MRDWRDWEWRDEGFELPEWIWLALVPVVVALWVVPYFWDYSSGPLRGVWVETSCDTVG